MNTGWLCPRCDVVNAPDVKRCQCGPATPGLAGQIILTTCVLCGRPTHGNAPCPGLLGMGSQPQPVWGIG